MFKKSSYLLISTFICGSLFANDIDTYHLEYHAKDKNCTATKNSTVIPFFDERFKKKQPNNPYTCMLMRKEQYIDCAITDKSNISALAFSYGAYENTNLIVAFKLPVDYKNGYVDINCSKHAKDGNVQNKD